jgi:hypothetical protein
MPSPPSSQWSEPEKWAWSRLCTGQPVGFNVRYGAALDPRGEDGWDDRHKLSSLFIETVLLHDPWRQAVTKSGLQVYGAWIPDLIDLTDASIPFFVGFDLSRLAQGVNLQRSRLAKSLLFVRSYLVNLAIYQAVIDGNLVLYFRVCRLRTGCGETIRADSPAA